MNKAFRLVLFIFFITSLVVASESRDISTSSGVSGCSKAKRPLSLSMSNVGNVVQPDVVGDLVSQQLLRRTVSDGINRLQENVVEFNMMLNTDRHSENAQEEIDRFKKFAFKVMCSWAKTIIKRDGDTLQDNSGVELERNAQSLGATLSPFNYDGTVVDDPDGTLIINSSIIDRLTDIACGCGFDQRGIPKRMSRRLTSSSMTNHYEDNNDKGA